MSTFLKGLSVNHESDVAWFHGFSWFVVGLHVFSRWFHGFWLVSMVFQGSFMFFMVFGRFPWFYKVVSWFLVSFLGFSR